MGKCMCRMLIESERNTEADIGKFCRCSKGCMWCAERNLGRTDWTYR